VTGGESEATGDQGGAARADGDAVARTAGRGGVAVLGAKAYFVVVGLVQQTLLPRAIGLAGYGALARVLAVANVVNNVTVTSSIQGVSRAVAGAKEEREEALRAALRVHVPLAVALAAAFALAAPAFAAFQGAPYIARPLTIAAGVVLVYGCYAPLVGSLNGRSLFTKQAALDTLFATLRTIGLIGAGALFQMRWGAGVDGAVVGFVVAALCITPIALAWAGTGRTPRAGASPAVPRSGAYLSMLAPLALAQLFTNALMQSDITLLGRFLSLGAPSSGLAGADAARAADEWVGVYRACQLFAFLPYQLVMSVSQVLFPMVARAHAEGDRAAVERYVERGARLGAIACGALVAVVAGLPASVLNFAYGATVAERGASTLRVLALGQGAFTMFGIATTVLASLGRERVAAALSLAAVAVVSIACFAGAASAPFGGAQLQATAAAATLGLVAALAGATIAVRACAGSFVPLATAVRVGAGVAAATLAGVELPRFGKLVTPVVAAGMAALYVAILVVTGEIGRRDLDTIRALRRPA